MRLLNMLFYVGAVVLVYVGTLVVIILWDVYDVWRESHRMADE